MPTRALQEATLLVLAALSRGSRPGHGIITDVREISGGRVKLRAGTLYTALDRLRADGLVGVDREEIVAGRPRRYYRLIPAPRHRLAPGPDLRVGDADRDAAAAALAEHYAQGRLTLAEFMTRLDAALTATTRSDIARTALDLPQLWPAARATAVRKNSLSSERIVVPAAGQPGRPGTLPAAGPALYRPPSRSRSARV